MPYESRLKLWADSMMFALDGMPNKNRASQYQETIEDFDKISAA